MKNTKIATKEIIKILEDNGGLNILTINLKEKTNIADYIVITTATSSRHAVTLANKLTDLLKQHGYKDIVTQGAETGNWIVIDTNEFIVHIFREEVRDYYQIEKIWG